MQKYEEPVMELMVLEIRDVITLSVEQGGEGPVYDWSQQ